MLEEMTPASFTPHIAGPFRVLLPDGESLYLQLAEVNASAAPGGAPRQEPFSLVFIGPANPTMPQRIYRLEHETLGTLELFLVPIGPGRYEAVFN